MSTRGDNWIEFATLAHRHIEDYTVPQYGDFPHDNVEKMTAEECIGHIRRYIERFGSNQRGKEDQLRDMFKICHYASFAYEKLTDAMADAKEEATGS